MQICVFHIHIWNLCRSLHSYKRKNQVWMKYLWAEFYIFASVLKNGITCFENVVHQSVGHSVHSQLYSTSIFAFPFLKYQDTPLLLSHQRGRQQKLLTIIYNSFCKPNTSVHRIMVIGTCWGNEKMVLRKMLLHHNLLFLPYIWYHVHIFFHLDYSSND